MPKGVHSGPRGNAARLRRAGRTDGKIEKTVALYADEWAHLAFYAAQTTDEDGKPLSRQEYMARLVRADMTAKRIL